MQSNNMSTKIINRIKYDTEKSKKICSSSNGNYSDFNYYYCAIYRTESGKFFLYEEGGAMSSMAISVGNNDTGGSWGITAMSRSETIEYAEKLHQDLDITAEELEKVYTIEGIQVN